eukprot:CAMPEP_0167760440 /NCGR_PEP_ID=MMETSP0110_2-20121227/11590_1 /TAXON_ID=629695 /ORGANISM="Gymnochlora sp., Strain CCMP2014" /LENGTH=444 /DNA_ID=CAMNT_0007646957 /DNA_START=331 /DNA_END=1665 /DNA_ORIENTATION=-
MQDLQKYLGSSHSNEAFRTFHVGGTNGKGSVCWKIAKSLESQGYRVGLFASPHISSFRERMSVNGSPISEDDVEALLPDIVDACINHDIPATFFELTTILSLGFFNAKEVDFAVYEVGLGGRLDSTNIITPDVSVITSVSLDHTNILGDTVEEIATEKGGIIKPGIPVVTGPNVPHHVLKPMAEKIKSPYVEVKTTGSQDFNDENKQIALTALNQIFPDLTRDSVEDALESLPPCRFQRFLHSIETGSSKEIDSIHFDDVQRCSSTVEVVLDVAHNPDAFSRLFSKLRAQYFPLPETAQKMIAVHKDDTKTPPKIITIIGLAASKDIGKCLKIVVEGSDEVYFVRARSDRALDVSELAVMASNYNLEDKCQVIRDGDVMSTVKDVINNVRDQKSIVVACGSFFLMKEVRTVLNIPQAIDDYDLNERFSDNFLATEQAADSNAKA